MRRRWLTTALLAVGAVFILPVLRAQAPAGPPVRFTVFASTRLADVAFVPRAGAAPLKLAFQPTARSIRYEYRGPMPLRFVDPTGGAVVAEAAIPAGVTDALLIFMPATPAEAGKAAGPPRYQIAVLDDGAARLAPGGLAIVNFSGLALKGTVNREAVTLKAGLNPVLAVGGSAKIALSTVFKNRTYQSYAGTATLGRNDRALLILLPPFYPGALEVQSRLLIDQLPGSAAKGSPSKR